MTQFCGRPSFSFCVTAAEARREFDGENVRQKTFGRGSKNSHGKRHRRRLLHRNHIVQQRPPPIVVRIDRAQETFAFEYMLIKYVRFGNIGHAVSTSQYDIMHR